MVENLKFKENEIYQGDCIELMKEFPEDKFDLIFVDPPYNLNKSYSDYEDTKTREGYLKWCERWMEESIKHLSPDGFFVVVNIPKWCIEHSFFLNKHLYFRSWVAWYAMSIPRGKIMPAHYGVLFYSKNPSVKFNKVSKPHPIDWCKRGKWSKKYKRMQKKAENKAVLTDIWHDIPRIKHSNKRDDHPCQLPEELLERIIKLTTDKGDLVMDPMIGTGTTAVVAKKLGRKYSGIDVDSSYVELTRKKLSKVNKTLEEFC